MSRQNKADSPSRQIDFIVITSNPKNDTKGKKRVRSVAASKGWPARRKKAFEHLENSGPGRRAHDIAKSDRVAKRTAHTEHEQILLQSSPVTAPQIPRVSQNCPPDSPEAMVPDESSSDASSASTVSTQDDGDALQSFAGMYTRLAAHLPYTLLSLADDRFTGDDNTTMCWCQECRNARRSADCFEDTVFETSQGVMLAKGARHSRLSNGVPRCTRQLACFPLPQSPSAARIDPFNCYPVEFHPWYDQILHHMLKYYCPRGWPALNITNDEGFDWEWYMTQTALSEPALFYVRLLFGTGDTVRLGTMPIDYTYYLRAKSVEAIQEALQDPKRAISDGMILAVGRIALYEHIFGNKRASREIHRPAQKRMIELRGGMKNLSVPNLPKRLMMWSDSMMAAGSDDVRFLEDDETVHFSPRESLAAVETWAPDEVPRVRSKINISDLVNDKDE